MTATETEFVWHQRGNPDAPVHLAVPRIFGQAWCGARAQSRHVVRPGTRQEVTCATCLVAIGRGRPMARGSR